LQLIGGFPQSLTAGDVIAVFGGMAAELCTVVLWIFIRGKTDERTLCVSEQGIETEIGAINAQIPWRKVGVVRDAGQYVLIARANGNAFFIPSRAFSGPDQKAQFLNEICHWRKME
jgi:hypothetical protein